MLIHVLDEKKCYTLISNLGQMSISHGSRLTVNKTLSAILTNFLVVTMITITIGLPTHQIGLSDSLPIVERLT